MPSLCAVYGQGQEVPYLPEATSGCPKRSEGGSPVGAKEGGRRFLIYVLAREDGIVRSDIRVPEAKRGRVPL